MNAGAIFLNPYEVGTTSQAESNSGDEAFEGQRHAGNVSSLLLFVIAACLGTFIGNATRTSIAFSLRAMSIQPTRYLIIYSIVIIIALAVWAMGERWLVRTSTGVRKHISRIVGGFLLGYMAYQLSWILPYGLTNAMLGVTVSVIFGAICSWVGETGVRWLFRFRLNQL